MKQYVYPPESIGLTNWPEGELRLDGPEIVSRPQDADVLVCPGSLFNLFRRASDLQKLPYFKGRERDHVFFDVSDHDGQYHQQSMFIRCNLRPFNMKADPNSISFAWPVEDYQECIEPPAGGFSNDVSFHGWVKSHATRRISTSSCKDVKLNCDFALYDDFTGYLDGKPEGIRRRSEFRNSMRRSRVALCPESISGVFPYRFWEAMSAGRVPFLIGSDFIFPFVDEVPYESFILSCPRESAHEAGHVLAAYLKLYSDADIIAQGQMAREYWLKYFDCRKWPQMMAMAVRKSIGEVASVAS